MSQSTGGSTDHPDVGTTATPRFSDSEWERIQKAAAERDDPNPEVLIREATLELVDDVLEDDAVYECLFDGCQETFQTKRQRTGHMGSPEHTIENADSDFWCGYCGYGPTTWRGVNAHHGSSPEHDGDPIRLDHEPSEDELVGVEIPDHRDQQVLERLYDEHDGCISALYRAHEFEVSMGRVRHYLIEYGIHEVWPDDPEKKLPDGLDRDRLEQLYNRYDGNVSAVHRVIDEDVPYRSLLTWLKDLDIHEPDQSHTKARSKHASRAATGDADTSEEPERDDPEGDPAVDCADRDDVDVEDEECGPTDEDTGDDADDGAVDVDLDRVLGGRAPGDVTGFDDIQTPDWLSEAALHVAVPMSDDAGELATNLGWEDVEAVAAMVQLLDLDVQVTAAALGGDRDG